MNYIWELFINILEASVFFIFVNGKFNKKNLEHSNLKQALVSVLLAGLTLILNITGVSPIIIILTMLVLHYVYTYIFFTSSHAANLFWVIAFSIATVCADALTTIIPTQLFSINISSILAGGHLRIPFTLIYITLLMVITLTLLCFSSKTFRLNPFEKTGFIFLSTLCISIEELIVVMQTTVCLNSFMQYVPLLYVIFFLVMILFVALTLYVYKLGLEKEKNIQLSELHVLSEMERRQYEQIISSFSKLRYMKHDINNHLETLSSLISNKEYPEAASYLHNLSASVNNNYYILASGNSTIDSIITNKLIQCKASQITVHYSVLLTNTIPLSNIELCSLLGNLFDNAIEACQKIDNPDSRIIDFSIKPYRDMLSIVISNRTNGQYLTDKHNRFLSSKSNSFTYEHGLGLPRITSIIESHGGIIDVIPDAFEFNVSILIPLNIDEENKEN